MTHVPTGNESPGYYVPAADASTQATEEDFIQLEPFRDASTQTTEEDFILLEPIRDAKTQTTEEDFDFLAQIQLTSDSSIETSEEIIDISETVFSECPEYKNDCNTVNTEAEKISLLMGDSRDFVMSIRSKNNGDEGCVENDSMPHLAYWMQNESNNKIITDYNQAQIGQLSNVSRCDQVSLQPLQIFSNHVEPTEISVYAGSCTFIADPQQAAHSCHQLTQAEVSKKTFVQSENYAKHSINDWISNFYECGKCGKRFEKESTLNLHVVSDCDPNPFQCDKCDRKFPFEGYFKKHYWVHAPENSLKCYECYYFTNSKEDFDNHLFTGHNTHICEICSKRFGEKSTFKAHVLSNCDPNPFTCNKCGQKFPFQSALTSHNHNHNH